MEDGDLKILIIDEDAESCRCLKAFVKQALPNCSIMEAATAEQALEQISTSRWHLVVIDPNLNNLQGFDLLPVLKSQTSARVLVFSCYPDAYCVLRALRSGADGYASKEGHPEELVTALRVLAAGKRYLSPLVIKQLGFD